MKKFVSFLLCGCLLVSLCGCKNSDVLESEGIPVEITCAKTDEMSEYYTVSALAKASIQAVITPKTPGKILAVHATIGDTVSQGSLLCSLDKSDMEQTVRTLQAQLEQANAGVESATVNSNRAEGIGYEQTLMQADLALAQAKSALDQAQVNLQLQTTNYQNMKTLYEAGNISRVNFEAAQGQYQTALSAYETAKAAYDNASRNAELASETAQDNIKTAKSGVANAQASKKVLLSQLETARKNLSEMDILSPIDGVVTQENANVGEMAAGALFTVCDLSKIDFEITIPESMVNRIYPAQHATVTVSAANQTVDATVWSVSPGMSAQSAGYTAIVRIENPDSVIKPGMSGSVSFLLNHKENTVVLPLDTLIEEDTTYVYVEKDGSVTKTPVTVGMKDATHAEILSGIAEGDRIVSRGQHSVSDGVKVRVVKEH